MIQQFSSNKSFILHVTRILLFCSNLFSHPIFTLIDWVVVVHYPLPVDPKLRAPTVISSVRIWELITTWVRLRVSVIFPSVLWPPWQLQGVTYCQNFSLHPLSWSSTPSASFFSAVGLWCSARRLWSDCCGADSHSWHSPCCLSDGAVMASACCVLQIRQRSVTASSSRAHVFFSRLQFPDSQTATTFSNSDSKIHKILLFQMNSCTSLLKDPLRWKGYILLLWHFSDDQGHL